MRLVVVARLGCLAVAWLSMLAPLKLYPCAPSELPGCVALWVAFVAAPSEVLICWILDAPALRLSVVGYLLVLAPLSLLPRPLVLGCSVIVPA